MSQSLLHQRPSDAAANDLLADARVRELTFSLGTIATGLMAARHYMPVSGRILSIKGIRRVAGDDNATTVDIKLNGTSVLDAVMSFAQASGANVVVDGVLDADHASYEAVEGSVAFNTADYLECNVAAKEGGAPAGLSITVRYAV